MLIVAVAVLATGAAGEGWTRKHLAWTLAGHHRLHCLDSREVSLQDLVSLILALCGRRICALLGLRNEDILI